MFRVFGMNLMYKRLLHVCLPMFYKYAYNFFFLICLADVLASDSEHRLFGICSCSSVGSHLRWSLIERGIPNVPSRSSHSLGDCTLFVSARCGPVSLFVHLNLSLTYPGLERLFRCPCPRVQTPVTCFPGFVRQPHSSTVRC